MSTHQNIWNAQHLTGSMYYGEVITFFHATSNTKPKPQFAVVSVLMPPLEDRTDVITEHKPVDLRTERTDDILPIATSLLGAMQRQHLSTTPTWTLYAAKHPFIHRTTCYFNHTPPGNNTQTYQTKQDPFYISPHPCCSYWHL